MNMKTLAAGLLATTLTGTALAATEADVEQSFFPYKNSVPEFPGLTPGMTLTSENVDQYKDALDAGMYQYIKDGWYDMKVGATTSLDLHPNYVKATLDNLNTVTLGNEVGAINGWVAGRPFPEEPDMNDPRAGE